MAMGNEQSTMNNQRKSFPGAVGAMEPRRLHPELGFVKRCCGEDTLGVAPRKNSSVPGQFSSKSQTLLTGVWLCVFENTFIKVM